MELNNICPCPLRFFQIYCGTYFKQSSSSLFLFVRLSSFDSGTCIQLRASSFSLPRVRSVNPARPSHWYMTWIDVSISSSQNLHNVAPSAGLTILVPSQATVSRTICCIDPVGLLGSVSLIDLIEQVVHWNRPQFWRQYFYLWAAPCNFCLYGFPS